MSPAAATTVLLLALSAALRGEPAADPLRVAIDSGLVEGTRLDREPSVRAFRGIPYAGSPAGAARWKPPQPVAPWSGVRRAHQEGPACPQLDREAANYRRVTLTLGGDPAWVPPLGITSEECLALNVFAPPPAAAARPVVVWVHGGANRFGSGKDRAAALARHGLVVVTFNYRLGVLGFLAHPALSRESPRGSSGNYALLDQIEALRWVRRNIGAFGGDPGRVTVVGHSAGGDSVAQLLASPLAEGLFHRAVIHSGGLGTSVPRAEMEAAGVKIAAQLGAPAADPLPALRAVPAHALLEVNGPFDATADGWVIPAPGPGALAPGHGSALPLLVGATTDEAAVFALPADRDAYRAALAESGPALMDRLAALYPAPRDEDLPSAQSRLMTDRDFVCPARYIAARRRGPTWLFHFAAAPTPTPSGKPLGAFHGTDIHMLFDIGYGLPPLSPPPPSSPSLADIMRRYWTHLAQTGTPDPPNLPPWPPYRLSSPLHLTLTTPLPAPTPVPPESCPVFFDVWDSS
jgi:para-nitrobenzyl esterase